MGGSGSERSGRVRFALSAYRALGQAVHPFMGVWLRARARRGKEVSARIGERFGRSAVLRPNGPLVWLHAASVGELNSVLPLTHRLRELGLQALVTTGTVTSASIAEAELPDNAIHQFRALDTVPAVRRFLDHWRPDLAVTVESEIWPVTMHELSRRGIQQVMVNARMSDRSFGRWAKRHRLARDVMGQLGHVVAQSDLDAERYRALGAPRVAVSGNLKADVTPLAFDEEQLADLRNTIGNRPVWTAASLHPAEDDLVFDAIARLRERHGDALAVVVPRHPERGPAMRTSLEARGLQVSQRSQDDPIEGRTDVLLADTLGEMGLWYRLAPVAFMGRSLAPEGGADGGQNPIEPVLCGAVVLSGRAVANFRDAYRNLLLNDGARLVDDSERLAEFVSHLWQNEERAALMRAGGRKTVDAMTGALDRTFRELEPWLAPLRMQIMLERTRKATEGHVAGLSEARLRAIRDAEVAGRAAPMAPLAERLAAPGE